jgi:hypothetical protein
MGKNQVKNRPDLTRQARNNPNPADLPDTRLIYPIVYVALKTIFGTICAAHDFSALG